MDSYQILKTIHKVGHPINGTVIGYEQPINNNGMLVGAKVLLETSSDYKVVLPFENIFDKIKNLMRHYFQR